MKNDVIVEQFCINEDLFYLEKILYELDNYAFDSDISSLIKQLKQIVIKKLYSNFNKNGLDIINSELILKMYLNNKKNI